MKAIATCVTLVVLGSCAPSQIQESQKQAELLSKQLELINASLKAYSSSK